MENSLGQYCIYVSDIDRAVAFWEGVVGIPVQSRTDIPGVKEVVLQAEAGGSRLQLASEVACQLRMPPAPRSVGPRASRPYRG